MHMFHYAPCPPILHFPAAVYICPALPDSARSRLNAAEMSVTWENASGVFCD